MTTHVNPYFLRLNFSKSLIEDDDSSALYDPSSGYLTVTLSKQEKGEVFDDLDLLAKLLAPKPTTRTTPSIEVLSDEDSDALNTLVDRTEDLSIDDAELAEGMKVMTTESRI